ncbi:MAG: alpha/beta hydrolase [Myxococcota bacterium]
MRGRNSERMVTIARRDAPAETLEGIFLAGASSEAGGALLAPPHPLYGGSLESPLLTELAFACTQRGLASLRFNWRGVGACAGKPSGDGADADTDYFAALDQLAESVAGPLVAGGYSFGSAAAVRAARAGTRIERLLLVAPPPALIAPAAILATGIRALVLVGEYDAIAPARELAEAFERAPQIELHVVPHADHFFMEGLAEIGRLAAEWLERS